MNRMPIGLAACLIAAVTAGCGTVTSSQAVTGGPGMAPGATGQAGHTPGTARYGPAGARPASTGPAGGGALAGCQGPAPAGQSLLITTASNGKTYCVRVGQQVDVQLRGTRSSPWLGPLASSNVLTAVPNGELSLVAGLTEEWFAGARPGQVIITSVRPPCRVSMPQWKTGIQPAFPVPKSYPLRFCAPEHRFSVSIIVVS
jgi:hypothetical protein